MLTEDEAIEIARDYADPADADWNKIAAFALDGTVLPGLANALREARREEAHIGGEVASNSARGLPRLIQYVETTELNWRRPSASARHLDPG